MEPIHSHRPGYTRLVLLLGGLLFLFLAGCLGEATPDPEPPLDGLPPVIDGFQAPIDDVRWQDTESGAVGTRIGVVGRHFGESIEALQVFYNGVAAPIDDLMDVEDQEPDPADPTARLQRIVTRVPDGATTGPVVVIRDGIASQGKVFRVILVLDYRVSDILLETDEAGSALTGAWIGTYYGGVLHFDGRLDSFRRGDYEHLTFADGIASNRVTVLLKDRADRLLVGTEGQGLSVVTSSGVVTLGRRGGLPNDLIRCLHLTPAGTLVVGTNHGIAFWEGYEENAAEILGAAPPPWIVPPELETARVEDLLPARDGSGDLWVATWDGLWRISCRGENAVRCYPAAAEDEHPGPLLCLAHDRAGQLLVGTYDGGLLVFSGDRACTLLHRHPIPNGPTAESAVLDMAPAPEGDGILLATNGGLFRLALEEDGPLLESLRDGAFLTLATGPEGKVFLGSQAGIHTYEDRGQGPVWDDATPPAMLGGRNVHALAPDGNGGILVGTADGGLTHFQLDPAGASGGATEPVSGVPTPYVSSLAPARDAAGELEGVWVGTNNGLGLVTFPGGRPRYRTVVDWGDGALHAISGILPLDDGRLLLGTLLDGLLLHSGDPGDPSWAPLSGGTRFRVEPAEAFHMDDIEIAFFDFDTGTWREIGLYDIRLGSEHYLPGGGTLNRFDGEGPPTAYAHLELAARIRFGDLILSEIKWVMVLRGTAEGFQRSGEEIELELNEWRHGTRTPWEPLGVWSPNPLRFKLVARADAPAVAPAGPSIPFRIDERVSRLYWHEEIHGVPVDLPLAWISGSFAAEVDDYPVPEHADSPTYLISCLQAGPEGRALVGTQEDGLYRFDPEAASRGEAAFARVPDLPPQISALALEGDARLFVGTLLDGLYEVRGLDTGSPSVRPFGRREPAARYVTALEVVPGAGLLLVAVHDPEAPETGGLDVYALDASPEDPPVLSLTVADGLLPARVQDLLLREDALYLATTQGLCVIPGFAELLADGASPP